VDVVLRKVFDLSVGGADELSGYTLAICTAWGLSYALLDRVHIRIDTLYTVLPVRICAVLDMLGLAAFIFFMSFVTWHGFGVFAQSVALRAHSLSPIGTPLMIPQFIWFVGLVEFLLIASLLFIRAGMALVQGDTATVQRLIGSRTATEELVEELEDARQRVART
jgi:TRAP-type mannitol/chloroaromatic compound transport system permease small subunit